MPWVNPTEGLTLAAPIDSPKGFVVTPGEDELNSGSDGPKKRPTWGETAGAAFRMENEVGALASSEKVAVPDHVEPGFDAWAAIKGTKYEGRWDRFLDARNPQRLAAIQKDIDRELEDRKTLESAGWSGTALEMLAAISSPTTLAPGGAIVRSAKGGFSVAKSGMSVGAAAMLGTAAQEAALQAAQSTRTVAETSIAIGASAILGGLLGAGGAKLMTGAEWRKAVATLDAFDQEKTALGARVMGEPADAGAAAAPRPTLDGLSVGGAAAGALAKVGGWNPILRAFESPSAVYRQEFFKAVENTIYTKNNLAGIPADQAAETLMQEWDGGLARALVATKGAYAEHRKAGGQLSSDAFREEVGMAMRNGDTHPDPQVDKVAKAWRANVFDPLKEAAIEAKLLPEDVAPTEALSYFTRRWNRERLIKEETRAKGIFADYVRQTAPEQLAKFDRHADWRVGSLQREIDDLEMAKLRRAEEKRARGDDGEVSLDDDLKESDILNALRVVQGKAPKPNVETLSQWIAKQGGLVEYEGELAYRGITNNARPGFVRKVAGGKGMKGGMHLDDAALSAWEAGFMPEFTARPSIDDFLDYLERDFNRIQPIVREADRDKIRLVEHIQALENDLSRMGIDTDAKGRVRLSTSEDLKTMVSRVYDAMDAETDAKIARLKTKLTETQGKFREERGKRFLDGDLDTHARDVADEVWNTLTGRAGDDIRPEFIKITAQGPLKERTFHIPDKFVTDFLDNDVEAVGRYYTRAMGADVEITKKFGRLDMRDQIQAIKDDYDRLRAATKDEKVLKKLNENETRDLNDLMATRDLLRGKEPAFHKFEENYASLARSANALNYIRSLGEVVIASLVDAIRPAMVHGLTPYLGTMKATLGNLDAVKLSVKEAQLAGNVIEMVKGGRLATISEITDPYATRGPFETMLNNLTNVASKWNGIRIWTDAMKSIASVMTQNRILKNVENFGSISEKEKAYLAYLGIGPTMAERIAKHFKTHGEVIDGVRVANTEKWTQKKDIFAEGVATVKARTAFINEFAPRFEAKPAEKVELRNGITLLATKTTDAGYTYRVSRLENGEPVGHVNFNTPEEVGRFVFDQKRASAPRDADPIDREAVRAYRAAMNKDIDSIILERGIGDIPLFAHTPTGKALLQFKSFMLASHQRILMRGLQEDQARFLGGVVAMTALGMFQTWVKAQTGNRQEKLPDISTNPGWWVAEGLDRSGVFAIPFEVANTAEKVGLGNPLKSPITAFDEKNTASQRVQNRNVIGALAGPTADLVTDAFTAAGAPMGVVQGEDVKQAQKNAAERLLPFNSYPVMRQFLRYVVNTPD